LTSGKIKNIIFDLGNTLVYFNYCYFYDGVARIEKNITASRLMKYFEDNRLDLKIGSNKINIKEAFKKIKKKYKLSIGYRDFHFLYCDIFWENSQMKKFLEDYLPETRYKVFMLSNVDSSHINFIDHNFPYVRLIKKRVLSYKVKSVKPSKKIFRFILEKHGLDPKETLYVDDLKENILAGKKHKLNTIHYTSHKRFMKEFKKLTSQ